MNGNSFMPADLIWMLPSTNLPTAEIISLCHVWCSMKRSDEGEKWSNYYPFDDKNAVALKWEIERVVWDFAHWFRYSRNHCNLTFRIIIKTKSNSFAKTFALSGKIMRNQKANILKWYNYLENNQHDSSSFLLLLVRCQIEKLR